MKKIKVSKGEILLRQGVPSTKAFFVTSGLLRSYYIDKKGKEHTYVFAPEGWLIADSNLIESNSSLFIQALEDSVVIMIEKENKIESKHVMKIFKSLATLQKRIILLQSSSTAERYEHFVKTYPQIIQRVPQRMLASYLGVTPETLSAAKKKWHSEQKRQNAQNKNPSITP